MEFDPSVVSGMTASLDSGSFTIKDAPIHEVRGKYHCYASNELGTAVSKEAFVITEGKSHSKLKYLLICVFNFTGKINTKGIWIQVVYVKPFEKLLTFRIVVMI